MVIANKIQDLRRDSFFEGLRRDAVGPGAVNPFEDVLPFPFLRIQPVDFLTFRLFRLAGKITEFDEYVAIGIEQIYVCLLYTSPSPRDKRQSRMPSSA